MTPEREKNMRLNLADLTQEQLSDTCVQLQDVIDNHVNEKAGMKQQVTALGTQVPALQNKIADLEEKLGDSTTVGTAEFDALRQENAQLSERVERLQKLNEGLQEKLLG